MRPPAIKSSVKFGRGARTVMLAGLLLASAAAAAAAVRSEPSAGVLKVRLGGDAGQTRLVVELDRAVEGKLLDGEGTDGSVAIALSQAGVAGDMSGGGAGLIKAWSVTKSGGAAKIKLDLVRPATIKRRFLLPPGDGITVYRYVIDLSEDQAASAPAPAAPARKPSPSAIDRYVAGADPIGDLTHKAVLAKAPLQPLLPDKKVVVIDAGHGGHDPGAMGEDAREKNLTLAAAKALRDRLMRSGRYKVVMTRDTDVYVPLEKRVQIARKANADLFISLHADSGADPSLRGATAYTLSEKGAARAARRAIDRKDGFINVALPGRDDAVNRILLDLTQRGTVNRSATFAETLLNKISTKTELLNRSHRDENYMVLLAPDVPAVLLEMGFITNREDETLLANPKQRRELMNAAGDAIDAYFVEEARFTLR
jgi:N-acetylmuramoyl-L-alanine amidase